MEARELTAHEINIQDQQFERQWIPAPKGDSLGISILSKITLDNTPFAIYDLSLETVRAYVENALIYHFLEETGYFPPNSQMERLRDQIYMASLNLCEIAVKENIKPDTKSH